MKSQAKASGIKVPEVHRVDEGVDPNVKTRKAHFEISKLSNTTKPSE